MIESDLTFGMNAWFVRLPVGERKRFDHIVQVASKVTGIKLPNLEQIFRKRPVSKVQDIAQCPQQPLYYKHELLPSSRRLIT